MVSYDLFDSWGGWDNHVEGLLESIQFPNSLLYIEDNAFSEEFLGYTDDTPNDITLIFGENLISIGVNAFSNSGNDSCFLSYVTTIKFGNNLKVIDGGAFQGFRRLYNITFPESLERLGSSTSGTSFESSGLEYMTFGKNIKELYLDYVNEDQNPVSITINAITPPLGYYDLCDQDAILYVPKESVNLYKNSRGCFEVYPIS